MLSHLFRLMLAFVLVGAILAISVSHAQPPKQKPVDPDHAAKMVKGTALFKNSVRGLFTAKCLKCHSGDRVEGEFDMGTRESLLKGGTAGLAVVPGDARKSLLYQLVAHQKEPHMPHERAKLADADIAKIAEWIDLGAPFDAPLLGKEDAAAWTRKVVPAEAKKHWAFEPLTSVKPPAGYANPVDAFIETKLKERDFALNAPADRRTLLRRIHLDLIGLPPSPEEVEAFVNDTAPDAFEKVVDRLLASPHHGERWARHWLDLVRFAESHGFEHDYDRPTAYHYRDFVIQAFNQDMPFNNFTKWQIAGDEFAPKDPQALAATGYLAAGVHSTQITKSEAEKHRYDELDDIVGNIGTTFLGLTVGCARCHDHKFDPVPARDYYRMVAAFTTTVRSEMEVNLDLEGDAKAKAEYEVAHQPLVEARMKYERESLPDRFTVWENSTSDIARSPSLFWLPVRAAFAAKPRTPTQAALVLSWFAPRDPEWSKLAKAEREHAATAPKPKVAKMLISSEGVPPVRLHSQGADFLKETHFLRRGDPDQKERVAEMSFLQVLMPEAEAQSRWMSAPPAGSRTSFRRTGFANWLTDERNGAGHLLARVIVNRLWQHHMGRGLVATPSDFGLRSEAPTHPELLDFLASELIRQQWKLKPIHRLIITSKAYQQSSARDEVKVKADPENALFGRQSLRRLEAEVIRDSILFVGGTLDERMFGAGTLDERSLRRSIYFTVKRSKSIPALMVFDAPDGTTGVGERPSTTIAPQALHLMNNPQVRAAAKGFAKRLLGDGTASDIVLVNRAYLAALCREPSTGERADALAFLKGKTGAQREAALSDFCQVLFCLNEFLYVG